jgi:hypothetical protein
MRNDDFVLEVNGEKVDGFARDQVVGKILKNPKQVELLVVSHLRVVDPENSLRVDKSLASSAPPQPLTPATTTEAKLRTTSMTDQSSSLLALSNSRVSRLQRLSPAQSYGFSISKNNSKDPPSIAAIERDSPAFQANLRDGEFVLRINGIDLVDKPYAQILDLVRKQIEKGNSLEIETIEPHLYRQSGGSGGDQAAATSGRPRTLSHSDMAMMTAAQPEQDDFEAGNF